MIQTPSSVINDMKEFGWQTREDSPFQQTDQYFKYPYMYIYSFWSCVYESSQSMIFLEKAHFSGTCLAFQCPRFNDLINNHQNLQTVMVRFSYYTLDPSYKSVKYNRFVKIRQTPVIHNRLIPQFPIIWKLSQVHWVDVEGNRKNYSNAFYKENDSTDVEYSLLSESFPDGTCPTKLPPNEIYDYSTEASNINVIPVNPLFDYI